MTENTDIKVVTHNQMEIDICPCRKCNGKGIEEKEKLVSYHKNDYDYWNELCSYCDGEGREVKKQYKIKIEIKLPDSNKWTGYRSEYKDIETVEYEKLNGRKTEDVYDIKNVRI